VRNTGTQKSRKVENDENIPPVMVQARPHQKAAAKALATAEDNAAAALVAMQATPPADKMLMEEDAVCPGSDDKIEVLDNGIDDDYSGPKSDEDSMGVDSTESEEEEELDASKYEVQVFFPSF
jgi:hypothetical protein